MSVYKIFPETTVAGKTIDIGDIINPSVTLCRRYCNDIPECLGFQVSEDDEVETCKMYSKINGFSPSVNSNDFYLKASSPSYWPLWILIFGILVILFINRCEG